MRVDLDGRAPERWAERFAAFRAALAQLVKTDESARTAAVEWLGRLPPKGAAEMPSAPASRAVGRARLESILKRFAARERTLVATPADTREEAERRRLTCAALAETLAAHRAVMIDGEASGDWLIALDL